MGNLGAYYGAQARGRKKSTAPNPGTQQTSAQAAGTQQPSAQAAGTQQPAVQQPVLRQNLPGTGIATGRPNPGRRRTNIILPDGATKETDKERREDRRALRGVLLGYLKDQAAQDRADARQMAGYEHAERLAALRNGPRIHKFSATMNGGGGVRYRVKYDYLDRQLPQYGGDASRSWGPDGGRGASPAASRFEKILGDMINRLEDPAKANVSAGRRTAAREVKPSWDYSGWRPTDTRKGKNEAFVRNDFLGAMDPERSGRFQGGYLDPDYRDRWIEFHMGGIRPGDSRYDRVYREKAAQWDIVRGQLDRRWGDYGNTVLRGVDDAAAEKQGAAVARDAADVSAQTGAAPAEAAAEKTVGQANTAAQNVAASAMGAPAKNPQDRKKGDNQ